MNTKNRLMRIFISLDFIISIICTGIILVLIDKPVSALIINQISSLTVSTLAIIFSVFFAALAVIITSGDNEFVIFLQQDDLYNEFVWSYKVTFFIIFFALMLSLILFTSSLFEIQKNSPGVYPYFFVGPYVFFTLYALSCTIASTIDAIKYSEYRTKYLHEKNYVEKHKFQILSNKMKSNRKNRNS